MTVVLAYMLAVIVLWYAPICAWLLLVSSWARSMAILWAVLPPLGLGIAEKVAFDTSYVFSLIDFRLNGYLSAALYYRKGMDLTDPLALLTPTHFLGTPGLWAGLATAAILLAGAIWLRRNREPI
jgi:ABC-2 type transport system permease protein